MSGGRRYRWAVLAAGTAAQSGSSAMQFGVAVMLPALRPERALSLAEAGVVVAAPTAGAMLSLLAWGIAADRVGAGRGLPDGERGAAAPRGGGEPVVLGGHVREQVTEAPPGARRR